MGASVMAREMPTARASMEVATASGSMALADKSGVADSSSPDSASLIMLPPTSASRKKATQWSTAAMASANILPRK